MFIIRRCQGSRLPRKAKQIYICFPLHLCQAIALNVRKHLHRFCYESKLQLIRNFRRVFLHGGFFSVIMS